MKTKLYEACVTFWRNTYTHAQDRGVCPADKQLQFLCAHVEALELRVMKLEKPAKEDA